MIVPKFAKYILRILVAAIVFYGLFLTYKEETKETADVISMMNSGEVVDNSSQENIDVVALNKNSNHPEYKQQRISLGDKTYTVYIADTEVLRTKGLSGWKEMSPNESMVFVFDKEGIYPFWMKDMSFSIDIIWLDSSFKPVHIEKNVSPKTYPNYFKSDVPAKYVIEVPAGTIDQLKRDYK